MIHLIEPRFTIIFDITIIALYYCMHIILPGSNLVTGFLYSVVVIVILKNLVTVIYLRNKKGSIRERILHGKPVTDEEILAEYDGTY